MGPKTPPTKEEVSLREMRDFAYDVYDYIWNNHEYVTPDLRKNYLEQLSKRLEEERTISKHLTQNITNAIRSSQILLRTHFTELLKFSHPDINIFKKEAAMLCSNWLVNRSNIFVRLIDTVAIVAEIFLYCDSKKEFTLELNEAAEWFLEWIKGGFLNEFFRSGGWGQLEKISLDWYADLFTFLDHRMDVVSSFGYAKPKQLEYKCKLIIGLRDSPVNFPVPKSAMCEKCMEPKDEKSSRNFMYFRIEKEFKEALKVRRPVASKSGLKSPVKKFLTTKKESKTSEVDKDARKGESSGDISSLKARTESSSPSADDSSQIRLDVKNVKIAEDKTKKIVARDSRQKSMQSESPVQLKQFPAEDSVSTTDSKKCKTKTVKPSPKENQQKHQITSDVKPLLETSAEIKAEFNTSSVEQLKDIAETSELSSGPAIKDPVSSDLKYELPILGSSPLKMDMSSLSEHSLTEISNLDSIAAKDALTSKSDDLKKHQIGTSPVKSTAVSSVLKAEVELSFAMEQILEITESPEPLSATVEEPLAVSSKLELEYPILGSSPKKSIYEEQPSIADSSTTKQVLQIKTSEGEDPINFPALIAYKDFLNTIERSLKSETHRSFLLSEKYDYSFQKLIKENKDSVKQFAIKPYLPEISSDDPSGEMISSNPDKTLLLYEVSFYLIGKPSKVKTTTRMAEEKKPEGRQKSRSQGRKNKPKTSSEDVSVPVATTESEETLKTKF